MECLGLLVILLGFVVLGNLNIPNTGECQKIPDHIHQKIFDRIWIIDHPRERLGSASEEDDELDPAVAL